MVCVGVRFRLYRCDIDDDNIRFTRFFDSYWDLVRHADGDPDPLIKLAKEADAAVKASGPTPPAEPHPSSSSGPPGTSAPSLPSSLPKEPNPRPETTSSPPPGSQSSRLSFTGSPPPYASSSSGASSDEDGPPPGDGGPVVVGREGPTFNLLGPEMPYMNGIIERLNRNGNLPLRNGLEISLNEEWYDVQDDSSTWESGGTFSGEDGEGKQGIEEDLEEERRWRYGEDDEEEDEQDDEEEIEAGGEGEDEGEDEEEDEE